MPSILNTGDLGSVENMNALISSASTTPTTQPSSGNTFVKVMGGLVTGVANLFVPGLGNVLKGLQGASASANGSMDPATMLKMQQQIAMEQEAFTTASTIMKDRHDAAMTAIQNSKSS